MTESRQYKRTEVRRDEILQAAAAILSRPMPQRVTIEALAQLIDVTESGIYRHFTNKAGVFGALVEFSVSTLDNLYRQIDGTQGCRMFDRALFKAQVLLEFAEKNPGLTRLLTEEALYSEDAAVRDKITLFFVRAEKSIEDSLCLSVSLNERDKEGLPPKFAARLLINFVRGALLTYTATEFKEKPTEGYAELRSGIAELFLRSAG